MKVWTSWSATATATPVPTVAAVPTATATTTTTSPPIAVPRKFPNQTCEEDERIRLNQEMHKSCDKGFAATCGGRKIKEDKYDGGLIIQAGPYPQIGDTTRNLWPEHYVTLAKVLKKIQIKEHYGLIQKKRGALDNEFMKEWVFRFDGK